MLSVDSGTGNGDGTVTIKRKSSGGSPTTLFSDGFETGNASNWTAAGGSGSYTYNATYAYTGSYGVRQVASNQTNDMNKTFGSAANVKASTRINVTAQTSNTTPTLVLASSTTSLYLERDASGRMWIYNTITGGTSSDATSTFANGSGWHYLEMEAQSGNGTGYAKVWLDGVEVITYTTINAGTTNWTGLYMGEGTNWTGTRYYDDVLVVIPAATTYYGGNLTVEGSLKINAPATTNSQRVCHNQGDGATTNMTLGDCASGGADYAEYYRTVGGVEPGDIVAPAAGSLTVGKTTIPYQPTMTGVVSTNPVVDGILGQSIKDASRQPIALAGRVPLKVSLENGAIKAGDPLTASSTPGVAMLATKPGRIIGTALEDYDSNSARVSATVMAEEAERNKMHAGELANYTSNPSNWATGVGKIMALNNPSYYDPRSELQGIGAALSGLQSQIDSLSGVQGGTLQVENMNITGHATINFLDVTGQANIGSITVASNATIGGDLVVVGSMTMVSGSISTQNITVQGHIITSGNAPQITGLTAVGQNAVVAIDGNDTAGTITVTAGATAITDGDLVNVKFSSPFSKAPKVVLSPAGRPAASLQTYSTAQNTEGFVLGASVAPVAGQTYIFNYFVVE